MTTSFIVGLAGAWLLCGAITGYVMRRRGHDLTSWLLFGVVLGPFVVPLAVERVTDELATDESLRGRTNSPGSLDLLVGIDGSPEGDHALASATRLLGPFASSLTLATVVDYDAPGAETEESLRAAAVEMLEQAAGGVDHPRVGIEVLYGRPDKALCEYAASTGKELIVVGPRGHGAQHVLFGSVAKGLAGGCDVPVMIGRSVADRVLPFMTPD